MLGKNSARRKKMNSSASFRICATKLAGIAVFLAALASPVWAQATGSLVGTVKDQSDAVVPAATVSLYRQGMTEPAAQTRTNGQGFFEFPTLQPESYKITIEKTGFAPYEATGVTLSPGAERALNGIKLSLGKVTVSVNAGEKLASVQTSDAEISTTLTAKQTEDLPIKDFNPLELLDTQAGVVSTSASAYTTIDGLRTSFSNVTFDGINVQDNTIRFNGLNFLPNNLRLGQVDQFTLVTSNQAAIYGNGATQTAFVSPSGTNNLHGSAFYLNANDLFNAGKWFENQADHKDFYKYNEGGFNVGGPLVRNKLFGYLDYEFYREPDTIDEGPVPTLSAADRAQIGTDSVGLQVDSRIAALLNQIPAPNFGSNEYEHSEAAQTDSDNVIAKLDFVPSRNNRLVASYAWNRYDEPYYLSIYGNKPGVAESVRANVLSLSWRTTPSSRLTNELRFGFSLYSFDILNRDQTLPYYLDLGEFDFVNPVYDISPQGRTTATYDLQDNASYVAGRHNLRFGIQAQLIRTPIYLDHIPQVYLGLNPYSSPAPTIDQQIQAILSGQYYFISENFYPVNRNGTLGAVPQTLSPSLDNYAPYFQDNWKASSRLTLTLGLRYDYYGAVTDQRGLLYGLADGNLQDILNAPSLTYSLQGSGFYRPGGRNLAPSVGVAFDPSGNGRTAIRASYGISYVNDDFIGSFTDTLVSNVPDNNMGFSGPGTLASISLPAPPTGGQVVTSPGTSAVVNDRLRTPYVQQWSLGVQHLIGGYVFDLRYVGNHAVRLWRTDELFGQTNSFGLTNELIYLSDPSGSTYNALQFDVSHRVGPLQLQANYTYSKALTDSNSFTSLGADPFRDPSNYSLDKGPAAFDIRHAFKANLVYDLPFGRGRSASMPLRPVLGGWSISAIAIVTSGAPFSILTGDNINPNQTANASTVGLSKIVSYHMTGNGPSMIASSAIAPNGTGTGYDASTGAYVPFANSPDQVFFDPAAGQPGTLGPRSFYGPGYFNLDLALQKRFRITERQSLEFRCVAINALNHPAFGFFNQYIDIPGFGLGAAQINYSRSLQLRLYYRF